MDDTSLSGVDTGGDSAGTDLSAYTGGTDVTPQSDASVAAPDFTTATLSPEETAAPEWLGVTEAVDQLPADDSDLAAPNFPHAQGLRDQRQQIRTLNKALKEHQQALQQWQAYSESLGNPESLQGAVQLRDLLYSPLTDNQGYFILDPKTQTPYITTVPYLEYLDEVSPGMPEQLLTDLLGFQPLDERGQRTLPMYQQVLNYWDAKNPGWWKQRYGVSDTPSPTTAVSPQELNDIPPEYHAAYKQLPVSIRNAWVAFDEADQIAMLHREQQNLERDQREVQLSQQAQQQAENERQQHAVYLAEQQAAYFDQVRRERFTVIAQQLAQQLTFSPDAATDAVMRGSVLTLMANLLNPDWHFVSAEALRAMNIQLGQQFDAALNSFDANANNYVAFTLAGDMGQATTAQERANDAANFLTTRLGVIALQVAKKMGAQQRAAASTQAGRLAGATTTLPSAGNGTSPNGQHSGILPPGMTPGSADAARWLAQQTGFVRN
jgi:hypothetical protein